MGLLGHSADRNKLCVGTFKIYVSYNQIFRNDNLLSIIT